MICAPDGSILEIVRDDYQVAPTGDSPSLQTLVDEQSIHKVEVFLAELQEKGSSFGWEINMFYQNRMTTLHFAGGLAEGKMLILAAKSRSEVYQFYNQIIHTNNDYVDSLRDVISEQARLAQVQIDRDSSFFDDLTDLYNQLSTLQRQLAKQNVELERLDQQKNHFLGMAAHDLRGPLTAMLSYSDFLIDETQDILSAEHLKFLGIIRSSSEFMAALVSDLLDISTIESGQLRLNFDYIDLVALVEERIEISNILANRKGITISLIRPAALPWIEVDPAKIRQVVDNLISNAIKYSPENNHIEVTLIVQDNEILFTVKDQGAGIPADELDKLFKFFGRTSVRSPHGEKSTGLGLAITQRIVHGHGGRIWVESEVGRGATLFVALPVTAQPPVE